jgi:hypothetical protein
MSKFNKTPDTFGRAGAGAGGSSPIVVDRRSSARTFEGAPSFARSDRGQLFLTSTAGFIAENKFYETGDATVQRVRDLTAAIATEAAPRRKVGAHTAKAIDVETGRVLADETDTGLAWLSPFVDWLRRKGNMRTAPIVIACEAVHARLAKGIHGGNRELLRAALLRADEPGEMISYWRMRFGRAIPMCMKRAIIDTLPRLYTEFSALKYDTASYGVRFGDVVDIVHPVGDTGRNDLYTWLLDRRHNRADAVPVNHPGAPLPMVRYRAELERIPVQDRRVWLHRATAAGVLTSRLDAAGATWEWLSGWLSDGQGMTAEAWEAVIPQMGYMALLRNLANFDKAGVSDSVAAAVAAKLADPDQVARSKQFPFRFLSAYRMAAASLRWGHALNMALTLSTQNIPALDGRTLILVDTSGSMAAPMSGKSQVSCVDAAALFGVALAFRNRGAVDLAGWATGTYTHTHTIRPGAALIEQVQQFTNKAGSVGHGTDLAQALRKTFRRGEHTRVFVFSDMQLMAEHWYGGTDAVNTYVPAEVPVYSFNLAGYAGAMTAGTNRHELGGLTDATFRLIPIIEAAQTGRWPWEMDAA